MTQTPGSGSKDHGWRDLRDGHPPPSFDDLIRAVVRKTHAECVPPLTPLDVVMLVGEALAGRFFYPVIARRGSVNAEAYARLDALAIHRVLVADREYSTRAGILWAPSPRDQVECVARALHAWQSEVLMPALGLPAAPSEGRSSRASALRYQVNQIFKHVYRPDFADAARVVENATVNNVGGNEFDPKQRERVSTAVVPGWIELVFRQGESSDGVLAFNDSGGLSLAPDRFTAVLNTLCPPGEGLRPPERHQDSGSVRRVVGSGMEDPLQELLVRDLLDLRDSLDLQRLHPPLADLVDAAARHPELVHRITELLLLVGPRLNSLADRADQAAIVYELGRRGGTAHGIWTRQRLEVDYGVTARRIESRAEWATAELSKALAA